MKYMVYIGIAAAAVLLVSLWLNELPAALYRRKKEKEMPLLLKTVTFLLCALLLSAGAVFGYLSTYYRADETAGKALLSDADVIVKETAYGFFFDGWGTESALIFYPGAMVDEKAYAPLLKNLAGQGVDCFLLRVPYHLAVLEPDAASKVLESGKYYYSSWFAGGHSLGGIVASSYANAHADKLDGLILLASYPAAEVDERLILLSVYGSEDHVLNMNEYQKAYAYWPSNCREAVITGGNHAQFGNYGEQKSDGEAKISSEVQQRAACEVIRLMIREGR